MTLLDKIADQSDLSLAPPGYRLGTVLGAGGMGVVHSLYTLQGEDTPLAVKMVHPFLSSSSDAELQLAHEAEIEKILNGNESVVQTLEYARHEKGHGYKIMRRMEGLSLKSWLFQNQPYLQEVSYKKRLVLILPIVREIFKILDEIHAQNIIHGDVKPSNIFINDVNHRGPVMGHLHRPHFIACDGGLPPHDTPHGHLIQKLKLDSKKLCLFDFGLAEYLDHPNPNKKPYQGYSRFYSSPAQLVGKRAQSADDIYSLAMIFGETLFGREQILRKIMPESLTKKSALFQFFVYLIEARQRIIDCNEFDRIFRNFCAVKSFMVSDALFPPAKFAWNPLSRQKSSSFARGPIHPDAECGQAFV